jgi:Na+-translocating ferredoxin:NAD+ oxidoreductase subunit C
MKQRSLEEVKALSKEEAVEIMRQVGILGAGAAGSRRPSNTRTPALFLGKPVTTKVLSVYGEDIADLKVYD